MGARSRNCVIRQVIPKLDTSRKQISPKLFRSTKREAESITIKFKVVSGFLITVILRGKKTIYGMSRIIKQFIKHTEGGNIPAMVKVKVQVWY